MSNSKDTEGCASCVGVWILGPLLWGAILTFAWNYGASAIWTVRSVRYWPMVVLSLPLCLIIGMFRRR